MQEILFSNTSLLNKEAVDRFNKVTSKRIIGYGSLFVGCFSGIVGGLLCLVNLFLGISIIGVGFVIGIPLIAYLIKDAMKKDAQKLLDGKKYLVHFDFYEEGVKIRAEESLEEENKFKFSGEEEFSYEEIAKIVVSGTEIYIQRISQANILDQRGMTKSTAGELIQFLEKKGIKVKK